MLILSRKVGQVVVFNKTIKIMITSIRGGQVKLGIDCPRETEIERLESTPDDPGASDSRSGGTDPDKCGVGAPQ